MVAARGGVLVALTLGIAAGETPDGGPQDAPAGTDRSAPPAFAVESVFPPGRQDPVRAAIESGLVFLERDISTQASGRVSLGDHEYEAPIGLTALAALAFMAGGSSPTRGPHQRSLERALDYLLDHQVPAGDPREGYITATEDRFSRTHGHGFAVLALTQAYSLSPRSSEGNRIAEAIELGVRRIEGSQGPDGGWYYDPLPVDVHEGSVTICMLQALRGAHNTGFHVDTGVIARAVAYVESLQDEDGGFLYSKQQPTSSVALTAAALSTLHSIGIYEGPAVDEGYLYLWRHLGRRDDQRAQGMFGAESRFPWYERMYLSQALWQHRDPLVFRRWAAEEFPRLLTSQRPDGSWIDRRYDGAGRKIDGRFGSAYATSMAVLVLSVSENWLPIYQR